MASETQNISRVLGQIEGRLNEQSRPIRQNIRMHASIALEA